MTFNSFYSKQTLFFFIFIFVIDLILLINNNSLLSLLLLINFNFFIICYFYQIIVSNQILTVLKSISRNDVKFWLLIDKDNKLVGYSQELPYFYSVTNLLNLISWKLKGVYKIKNKKELISSLFLEDEIQILSMRKNLLIQFINKDYKGISNNYRKIINHDLPSLFLSIKVKVDKISKINSLDILSKEVNDLQVMSDKLNFLFKGIVQIYKSQEINYEKVNVKDTIEKAILYLQEIYVLFKRELVTHLKDHWVTMDSNLLLIIIFNLLKNCVDHNYTHQDLKIKINLYDYSDVYVLLEIKDNGLGIEDVSLQEIFREGVKSNTSKGYGYGLSLCYDILNLYQGKIEVESNSGFTVKVYLLK